MGHRPRYVTAYAGNHSFFPPHRREHHSPPSKSMAHRAVLCAALATGSSHITNLEFSKDIAATLAAAGQLCARVTTGPADAVVEGLGRFAPLTAPVDCCESGSTLRFLIPIASLTGQEVTFTGRGRLMERPQSVYETLYREQDLRFEQNSAGLTVEGALTPGSTGWRATCPASSSAGCCLPCPCWTATAPCTSSRRWRAAATST